MSTSASVFSSHLNYYSRHSRIIPNHMPDSLYYEIGQPLPFIELEFRCAQHPPVAVESSEMDFDKYEDIVVNEHHNHVIPEVKVDHFDESPPMIPTQRNEELDRSQDLIKQNSGDEAPPLQEEEIVTTSHIVDEALQEHNNDEIKEAKDQDVGSELGKEDMTNDVRKKQEQNQLLTQKLQEPPNAQLVNTEQQIKIVKVEVPIQHSQPEIRLPSLTMPVVKCVDNSEQDPQKILEEKPKQQNKEQQKAFKKIPFRLAKKQPRNQTFQQEKTENPLIQSQVPTNKQNRQMTKTQNIQKNEPIESASKLIKKNFKKAISGDRSPIRRLTEGSMTTGTTEVPKNKLLMRFFESNS